MNATCKRADQIEKTLRSMNILGTRVVFDRVVTRHQEDRFEVDTVNRGPWFSLSATAFIIAFDES